MRAWKALLPAAGTVALTFLTGGVAYADPAPSPRLVEGNVTTCEAAGLSGTILFEGVGDASGPAGSGDVSDDMLTLDVTINAGWTASGVAVKGGNDTNVYDGPFVGPTTIDDMKAPLNMGGQQSAISHWLVCGEMSPPPPPGNGSPSPTPPPTVPPPPGTPTPTPPATATPTGTPPPSGPARTGGGGSQGSGTWLGIIALIAAAASAGFLMLRRKRS